MQFSYEVLCWFLNVRAGFSFPLFPLLSLYLSLSLSFIVNCLKL